MVELVQQHPSGGYILEELRVGMAAEKVIHVSDERIRDVLRSMTSAQQACEDLLQEALEGGGSDNITIVVGRALPRDAAEPA